MDPRVHKRFLDYRERFIYFAKGAGAKELTPEQFVAADAEQRALAAKGGDRDDEEEARLVELSRLLYRD
ncbi:MAG TPA: hypothetical protein VIF15_11300 [Polyangiaceae bacterium]|jgi:hypothetical protein